MNNECIICFNDVNHNDVQQYSFHQQCNCYYNVHNLCFVAWLKKKRTGCLVCHKPITYSHCDTHKPFKPRPRKRIKCCSYL